jgi:hypothetical protein
MDTLRDRLAELADDAPTGGAPAAELWARGKRAQRVRVTALAATVLVVGAVGTGIGLGRVDGGPDDRDLAPARTIGFALPIAYPVGQALPELGDAPGPLAAVWLVPRQGGSPEAVGLVAGTARFGRLPIDLPQDDPEAPENVRVALSPDGRKLAYTSTKAPAGAQEVVLEPVVRDLVSGRTQTSTFGFGTRVGGLWVDDTHLFGLVAGGSDGDGWLWEPGQVPTRVNPYEVAYAGSHVSVASWPAAGPPRDYGDGDPGSCTTLNVYDAQTVNSPPADVPGLCNLLGVIGSDVLLGHRKDPNDGHGTVVALTFQSAVPFCPSPPQRCELSVDDGQPRVVATAGAPSRVTFATELIGKALDAGVGRS